MDGTAAPSETFAAYYAKYLIAKQGFQPTSIPELQRLVETCDYVLAKTDIAGFTVAAIVDREARPGKTFAPSTFEVETIAEDCLKYAGQIGRAKIPATIKIYEVGPGVDTPDNQKRLVPYQRQSRFSKAVSMAWLLDTGVQTVWTNARFGGGVGQRKAMENLLKAPRVDQDRLVPPQRAIATNAGPPLFTFTLLIVLLAIFVGEVLFGLDKTGGMLAPSLRTLDALGALSYVRIVEGYQWWRLFTAPLLHADLSHILLNGLALFLIGRHLERLIGWRWMAGSFAVSAVCGSLMSLAINPHNLIGVGASGGIVGLFAAGFITSFRAPAGVMRTKLQVQAIYGLIPALLPFLNAVHSGTTIDYGAHFGGAIGGVAMGFLLLGLWPGSLPRPRWANLGAVLAVGFFGTAAASALPILTNYREQQVLMPDWPVEFAQQVPLAAQAVQDYPHDPRVRLAHAIAQLQANDSVGAEADLRAGLSEKAALQTPLFSGLGNRLKALLAIVLYDNGKQDEAKETVRPACETEINGPIGNLLKSRSLCP